MQQFEEFHEGSLVFVFRPPIKIFGLVRIETIGELVGEAVVGDLRETNPEKAEKVSRPISSRIDETMKEDPADAIIAVQNELAGRSVVTVGHLYTRA